MFHAPVLHSAGGPTGGVIIEMPLVKGTRLLFVSADGTPEPMPTVPSTDGRSVSLSRVLQWNSDTHGLVALDDGSALQVAARDLVRGHAQPDSRARRAPDNVERRSS